LHMLMLRLSANPMSNGASLAVKPGSTPVWYAYHTGVLACKTLCFSRSGELHEKVICIYFLKYC
ncbi:hypothetical protein, partial [Escherichia coli]|uniref:hypothetical protein n=2 Tax=Escherichia TaxID=561 RepID=UPI0028549E48